MKEESLARPGRDGPDVMGGPIKRKTILSKRARRSRMRSRNLMACANLLSDSEENTPDRTDLRGRVSSRSSLTPWAKRTVWNSAQEAFNAPPSCRSDLRERTKSLVRVFE
jgi:hypothetical protein